MSQHSQRVNSAFVTNSDNLSNHYNRESFSLVNSNSNNNSGQVNVLMNVADNWSSRSTLGPITSDWYWRR